MKNSRLEPLVFSTTNDVKFSIASSAAENFHIELVRQTVDVDEIQGEDPQRVVVDKANKVFDILKRPIVVSDDSWNFVGLRGFPGVYMKSINAWFKAEDFLRLVKGVDRKVFLTQLLVYQDELTQKLFMAKTEGQILNKPRGQAPSSPNWEITTMDGDDGLSIAEVYMQKRSDKRAVSQVWYNFFDWYKNR